MILRVAVFSMLVPCASAFAQEEKPGYTDTPQLPDQRWRVHDAERPHPRVVDPGPAPEHPAPPPSDATVLFDGSEKDASPLSAWRHADGQPARWKVEDGAMVVNGTGDIETEQRFGDCQLHVEWMVPPPVESEDTKGQARGNSGVFLFGRYEIQVLDSYENATYADGQAAALYGQHPPLVNACRPPGEWQTYDLVFRAPRFDRDGELLQPARVTMFHNGVLVHDDRAFLGATRHRAVATYSAHETAGVIRLQDHGNPVHYRNVWAREIPPRRVGGTSGPR